MKPDNSEGKPGYFDMLTGDIRDKSTALLNEIWTYKKFLQKISELQAGGVPGKEKKNIEKSSAPAETSLIEKGHNQFVIGKSENGEQVLGFVFGSGPKTVSLVAGAHADEPIGPNTLYRLVCDFFYSPGRYEAFFSRYRMVIIPHVNPDGDAANAGWVTKWPDPVAFMTGTEREPPGRDVEFGYPGMRVENRAAAAFWEREGPADLHISLHGMQFSEGFLLLINDEWERRTRTWREEFDKAMRKRGLLPHDHDRGGEKGFHYMGPGFTSTPKGTAMKSFFLKKGDVETAAKFHNSSMEFHQRLNPDVLCMVTEFPLFLVRHSGTDGIPENYLQLKKWWAEWIKNNSVGGKPEVGEAMNQVLAEHEVVPLPVSKAMSLQLYTIEMALRLL